jgi:hypothetical protein
MATLVDVQQGHPQVGLVSEVQGVLSKVMDRNQLCSDLWSLSMTEETAVRGSEVADREGGGGRALQGARLQKPPRGETCRPIALA